MSRRGKPAVRDLAEGTVKVWGHNTATGNNRIPVTHSPIKIQTTDPSLPMKVITQSPNQETLSIRRHGARESKPPCTPGSQPVKGRTWGRVHLGPTMQATILLTLRERVVSTTTKPLSISVSKSNPLKGSGVIDTTRE